MLRVLILVLASLAAMPAVAGRQDDAFLVARDAYVKGNRQKLADASAQLRGYVLEPYAEYWQLMLRLPEAAPGEVSDFLNRQDGTLVAEQLRREWLKILGVRGEWPLFSAAYPGLVNEDPEVACYNIQARWRAGDTEALADVRRFWNAPKELPQGCAPLAEAEIAAGRYTTRQIWERVRLLLEAGQVRAASRAIDYLPAQEAPDPKSIASTNSNPERHLGKHVPDLSRRANREIVIFALTRLAQKDPQDALGYWTKPVQEKLSREDQAYVWGQLGFNAAKRHLPEALEWYARSDAAQLSDEQLAWRVRAGLRAGNWKDVKATIARMSVLSRNDPTWIYWDGRAARALGENEAAETAFRRVAGEHHFYGKLALEELGGTLTVPGRTEMPTQDDLEEAARSPGLTRALTLFQLDLRSDAVREWNWTLRGMSDRQLLAAAEVARRASLWDRAINTADRTVGMHDFSLRFLAPYKEAFAEQAKAQGLEESWVLGLVRQESRFITSARSSAGASGLMQLMPATAKWVAKRNGMKEFSWARVTDPDVNIALGTSYLRYVLEELDGSPVLAAAAYNAGPGRARKWKADTPLEGAIYAETIPFNETRDYVKRVMSNTMYYAFIYGGDSRSLKARLGTIPSRQGGEGYAGTITGQSTVQ